VRKVPLRMTRGVPLKPALPALPEVGPLAEPKNQL
jgi:hypothetical protein